VALERESWDRLFTWMDLNKPAHGTWTENVGAAKVTHQRDRRRDLMKRYAGIDEDPEAIPVVDGRDGGPAVRGVDGGQAGVPAPRAGDGGPTSVSAAARTEPGPPGTGRGGDSPLAPPTVPCDGWPFDASEAKRRQEAGGAPERTVDLGGGVTLRLRRIPAGRFVTGGAAPRIAEATAPFWIAACEVDNAQFARFDPTHDSRIETGDFLQFSVAERGWPLNGARQPVVRVSWRRAAEFCRWLSAATGEAFALPDETQWEYACRAGAATDLSFGSPGADFAPFANLADASFRSMQTLAPWHLPSGALAPYKPAAETVNDGHRVSAPTGSFQPNAWGLHDMHGNVAEWTSSPLTPGAGADAPRVVRGGSWSERPHLASASRRIAYPPWQAVHNVGFRVVCPVR
jgi:formylglycine-generating enzyme required for sulfatase activity